MKVKDLETLGFSAVAVSDENREIGGVYTGDLLSWVMGKGQEHQAWVTIMSNQNVIAVASLINFSCVILSENVLPEEAFLSLAREKQVNILSYSGSSYEACVLLSKGLS